MADRRSRLPLALAMGAGLAAAGAAVVATRRSAAKHRSMDDDRAGDAGASGLLDAFAARLP